MEIITSIGRIITVIAGILILITTVSIMTQGTFTLPVFLVFELFHVRGIAQLVFGFGVGLTYIGIPTKVIPVKQVKIEGIVINVLSIIVGSSLGVLAGIIIFFGGVFENSINTSLLANLQNNSN